MHPKSLCMTTITVKLNEKTGLGKSILELLKSATKVSKSLQIISSTVGKSKQEVYMLSDEEEKGLLEAEADIKDGRIHTLEESEKTLAKYLK